MDVDLQVGEVAFVNGKMMRYMGSGKFVPAEVKPVAEPLAKRFDDGRPLGGLHGDIE